MRRFFGFVTDKSKLRCAAKAREWPKSPTIAPLEFNNAGAWLLHRRELLPGIVSASLASARWPVIGLCGLTQLAKLHTFKGEISRGLEL